jgi:hypothetical protein
VVGRRDSWYLPQQKREEVVRPGRHVSRSAILFHPDRVVLKPQHHHDRLGYERTRAGSHDLLKGERDNPFARCIDLTSPDPRTVRLRTHRGWCAPHHRGVLLAQRRTYAARRDKGVPAPAAVSARPRRVGGRDAQ